MKLIAVVGAGLLLTGCAGQSETEPTPEQTADAVAATPDDKTSDFCAVFERWETTYREAVGETVDITAIQKLYGWANALEEEAPTDIAATVATYIAPIRMVEAGTDGSFNAYDWTQASNDLNIGCVGDLIDK